MKLTSARARRIAKMRKTYGAGPGRPRSNAPRCACGAMTLKRALARGHHCQAAGPRARTAVQAIEVEPPQTRRG